MEKEDVLDQLEKSRNLIIKLNNALEQKEKEVKKLNEDLKELQQRNIIISIKMEKTIDEYENISNEKKDLLSMLEEKNKEIEKLRESNIMIQKQLQFLSDLNKIEIDKRVESELSELSKQQPGQEKIINKEKINKSIVTGKNQWIDIEDIKNMVRIALQNNDSIDSIKESLMNLGVNENEVEDIINNYLQ